MIFSRIRNFITIKATSNYNRCKIDYNHLLAKTQFNLLSSKLQYNYNKNKIDYNHNLAITNFNLKTTTLNYNRIKAQAFYYLMPYEEYLLLDRYVNINYVIEGYVA